MQITEEKLDQIENDLIRFFRHVALPRYMKELRLGDEMDELIFNEPAQTFITWLEFNKQNLKNGNGN